MTAATPAVGRTRRQPLRLPLLRAGGGLAARVLAALMLLTPAAAAEAVPQSQAEIELSFAPLVKKAAPAVVNIYTRKVVQARAASPFAADPFFRHFFGDDFGLGRPTERIQNSLGSGVIVAPDGLVVTNHHVVKDSDEITVVLADRREFNARIVTSDERTDLALLRIDPPGEPLPVLELRDSDEIEVGDLVLAIGNPFGVGQTVTGGIVSALARTHVGIGDFGFFIQTDAAINPGNSGGALVGMDGRLVGINTAIFSRGNGGSIGIGFAIPSNMVATVIAAERTGGRLVRPWIGATGQGVTADLADGLGLDRPGGVIVNDLHPAGPAARAGLRVGDVVLAVDGRAVDDPAALRFRLATLPVGGKAELAVRRLGRALEIAVDLVAAPEDPPRDLTVLDGPHPLTGATVANLSPALAEELSVDGAWRGVIIVTLRRGSIAHRAGLAPGDILLRVNDREIDSVAALRDVLDRPVSRWRIAFRRAGETRVVVVG